MLISRDWRPASKRLKSARYSKLPCFSGRGRRGKAFHPPYLWAQELLWLSCVISSKQEIAETSPYVSVPLLGGTAAKLVLALPSAPCLPSSPSVPSSVFQCPVGGKIHGNAVVTFPLWSGLKFARGV